MKILFGRYVGTSTVWALLLLTLAVALMTEGSALPSPQWPNEPSGFSQITDWGFPTLEGNGWRLTFNYNTQIIDDATAPLSPTKVMTMTRPPNSPGGGKLYNDWPTMHNEVFFAFRVKTSNPFTGYANQHNKLAYLNDNQNLMNSWFYFVGNQGGPFSLIMYLATGSGVCNSHLPGWGDACGTWNLAPQTGGSYALGVWHTIELYAKRGTCASCKNGTLRWWLDGVQQAHYTTVNFPGGVQWAQSVIGPSWDAADPTWVTSSHRWDHVYVSAPGGMSSSDTTPPSSPTRLTVQ